MKREAYLQTLKAQHAKLEEQIAEAEARFRPDGESIRRLKKLKLMKKDKIVELELKLAEARAPKKPKRQPSAEIVTLPRREKLQESLFLGTSRQSGLAARG